MKLAAYLDETGTTLEAFGAKVGVAHSTVLRWARGEAAPRGWKMAERVAAATGGRVSPEELLSGTATTEKTGGLAEAQSPFASEARALGLDADAIAAAALKQAIGDEKARRWAEENREAIAAHTRYIEEHGLPLANYRLF